LTVWDTKVNIHTPASEEMEMAREQGETALLLQLLRDRGALSAAQLAESLELGRPRVMRAVARLSTAGLVRLDGSSVSRGGRPSAQIKLSPAVRLLGIDIGATSIDVALTDGELNILGHLSEDCDVQDDPQRVVDRVAAMGLKLRDEFSVTKLHAIGAGLPGPVRYPDGHMVAPPLMPTWEGFLVRDHLARALDAPVVVDNDVNAMALGELHAGVGRSMRDMLFVKLGTGIGCGVVLNGRLHRGSSGSAGDIGHIAVRHPDLPEVRCACGRLNCLEAYAGGRAIADHTQVLASSGKSPVLEAMLAEGGTLTARSLSAAAALGDAAAVGFIENIGTCIGEVLAGLVNFANPSMIVIGGGVSSLGSRFLASLRSEIYRSSTPLATQHLPIVLSEMPGTAGVVGGAYLASEHLFTAESYRGIAMHPTSKENS
jgi:glucokinase-like ROK family protein